MILVLIYWIVWKFYITRTCGDDPTYTDCLEGCNKILPAHAGMILTVSPILALYRNITRTCGDDPSLNLWKVVNNEYYPHMRGWSYTTTKTML